MRARKKLDIGWVDLLRASLACIFAKNSIRIREDIDHAWHRLVGRKQKLAVVCLSVRTGFDLLLSQLSLPRGSEVLVSAITIRDMAKIIEHHGLTAVPFDLDFHTLAPDVLDLAKCITPRTKMILFAHLFGQRNDLQTLVEIAQQHRLFLVEDCAQCFIADDYQGHCLSDVTMFSFGTIKTATALGGAILCVRDPILAEQILTLQTIYSTQQKKHFALKILKCAVLKLLTYHWIYALFVVATKWLGKNHDVLIADSVRGFSGGDFFSKIRLQPSAPLLTLFAHRLNTFSKLIIQARISAGNELNNKLDPKFSLALALS